MDIDCRCNCCLKLNQSVIDDLRDEFLSSSKVTQNTLLSQRMKWSQPVRRTLKTSGDSRRNKTWKYFLRRSPVSVEVCQKFFLGVFKISQKRLRVIHQKIIDEVADFGSNRGKQPGNSRKLADGIYEMAIKHLETFPYTTSDNTATNMKYLTNPLLTETKLYHLFRRYYEEKMGEPLQMSIRTYLYFFKRSNFAVRKPRADICDTCS